MKHRVELERHNRYLLIFTCIALCIAILVPNKVQSSDDTIEELIVTGKRPGPKLWKVQMGGNILWVMGIAEPLPKSLDWDDVSVKLTIGQSQVLLTPPAIAVSVTNPLKFVGIFRKYKKLQKLPKGKILFDVLSIERQQRYQKIIDKYGIKIDKKIRPLFVVEQLNKKASKRVGLENAEHIHKKLLKLAKSQKVDIIDAVAQMDIKQALGMLENLDQKDELKCFDATLEKLDQSVDLAVHTARAWVDGDHDALTEIALSNDDDSCADALLNSAQALAARADSKSLWVSQAQKALETNRERFAYLPIVEVVPSDGLVSTLKSSISKQTTAN